MLSKESYIPCGAPAMSIVFHTKDRRGYYMCQPCMDHNVLNRGGKLVAQIALPTPKLTKKPPIASLRERMKAATAAAAPSMVPDFNQPKPVREEEYIPGIEEVITDEPTRDHLRRLISEHAEIKAQEKALKAVKEPTTAAIKKLLGSVGKLMCDGFRVNYFAQLRTSIKKPKLVNYLATQGFSPDDIKHVLSQCEETSTAYALRITAPGEKEETYE